MTNGRRSINKRVIATVAGMFHTVYYNFLLEHLFFLAHVNAGSSDSGEPSIVLSNALALENSHRH